MVTRGLRIWFVVHFIADILFALPLFVAPEFTLGLFGWTAVDPVTTRLVAAALFGIGIESLLGRKGDVEAFRAMLNLKIIWSSAAVVGFVWCLAEGAPSMVWGFLAIFVAFNILWVTYRLMLRGAS